MTLLIPTQTCICELGRNHDEADIAHQTSVSGMRSLLDLLSGNECNIQMMLRPVKKRQSHARVEQHYYPFPISTNVQHSSAALPRP